MVGVTFSGFTQSITSITPDTSLYGLINISISGSSTNFSQATTTVWFSNGSSTLIYPFGDSIISNTSMNAGFFIDGTYPCTSYDLNVSNSIDGQLTLPSALTLLCPQFLSVDPDSANKGENLMVTISTDNMNLTSPNVTPTQLWFQQGTYTIDTASIGGIVSTGMNQADVTVSVPTDALCGYYDAYLSVFPYGTVMLDSAFQVTCDTEIEGYVYDDANGNGTQDPGELGLANALVEIQPGSILIPTDASGYYSADLSLGNYSVSVQAPNYYTQTSTPATYGVSLTTIGQISTGNDFGLQATASVSDTWVSLTGGDPIAGFSTNYWVNYGNSGTVVESGMLSLTLDSLLTFNSATPAPDSTSAPNSYFWDYSSLAPGQTGLISVYTTVGIGFPNTQLHTSASITDIANDTTPDDNVDSLNQVLLTSYDPNDKMVKPAGVGDDLLTLKDQYLEYTIRFQNTGNFQAFNVRVEDTLTTNLDLNTFQILGFSHPMTYIIDQDRLAIFSFDNILLPDSNANEPESHGFVKFRIRPITGLADSVRIENEAYIYFDFNEAVITNTIVSTMVDSIVIDGTDAIAPLYEDVGFKVYPNPFKTSTVLEFDDPSNRINQIDLYDLQGRKVRTYTNLNQHRHTIEKGSLIPGMYLFTIQGTHPMRGKLIISE